MDKGRISLAKLSRNWQLKWDNENKAWYVNFSEALFLLRFTGYTKKERQLYILHKHVDDTFRAINQNNNEDITIPCKAYQERLNKQIDSTRKEIKALEKEIKKDFDVKYYIELEAKPMKPIKDNKQSKFTKNDFFG